MGLWLERRNPVELDKNNRYALTYRSEVKIDSKVTTAAILIVRLITTVCQFYRDRWRNAIGLSDAEPA